MKSSELTKELINAKNGVVYMGYQSDNEYDEFRKIELAARTCYKSEDNISQQSAIKMVTMLVELKHFAMLRFGERTVVLSVSAWTQLQRLLVWNNLLQYWRYEIAPGGMMVTANLNSWILAYLVSPISMKNIILNVFDRWLTTQKILLSLSDEVNCIRPEPDVMREVGTIPERLRRHTFRVITDRGITHEIVRHTTLSYAQESTRYVKYNSKETMAWIPDHVKDNPQLVDIMLEVFNSALSTYQDLLNDKTCTAQDARAILPTCLKTEICISGYIDYSPMEELCQGFSHFINMRDSTTAHPGIVPIAQEIKSYLKEDLDMLESTY